MKVKDIAMMTVCLSILIIASKISISIGIIAITLQTFAVALIPYILKWKRSAIVFITYILMGLIGIPVFSNGGGFYYVLKPSFGFILGFLASLFITGSPILKNKKITFKFKGKKYTAKTNKKGIATLSLKSLKVGKYTITSTYGGCTVKNTIQIKK